MDGSHRHQDFAADVLLEGTQVLYWSTLVALRAGATWDDVRPDRALDTQVEGMTTDMVAKLLRAEATSWRTNNHATSPLATRLHAALGLVGQAVSAAGHHAYTVVSKDLDDLKGRSYLASFFDSTGTIERASR